MINYLQHHQINKEKWDECIDTSVNGNAYVYSWYLDVVSKNWNALILNDYDAVFPLALNSKFKITYLYQPFFSRYLGVYSKIAITETLVNAFLEAIPSTIQFIEFNIHENNYFENADFQKKERFFQFLTLNRPYQDIFQEYKGDAKRNLKKAEKNNLKIHENIAPEKIVDLFRHNKGKQIKELHSQDYVMLQNLMTTCNKHKSGIALGVTNTANELIAAGFFIRSRHQILFLKGSANAEGKALGAMYLMIDELVKTYAQKINSFDFGGSSLESIASFNHNFGAKNCVYLQVKKNNLPFVVKLISGKY
ncbi:MAG: GNAT family N-acetyltransferase [Bacteroidales bacterium]